MTRVVSLYLPQWSTDRLRRQSGGATRHPDAVAEDQPLVLGGQDGRRRVVLALDPKAKALGLRVGMALAKAQALVPGLVVRPADPGGDAAALERLALWALRFSPLVAADPPDGLVIDITGADHLQGGEAALLEAMVERFAATGIQARAAIADTWGAAHALARSLERSTVVTPSGAVEPWLRPLPIAALRLGGSTVDGLRTLGFERIGDLIDTPRAPLALRFGPQVGRRLDEALGRLPEPIEPIRSADLPEARRVFGEPIAAPETIARSVLKLVTALCADLEARGLGARRLDLLCQRVDNSRQSIRVSLAQPVRDIKRLNRLLCSKIETIDPGFGLEVMVLIASATEALAPRQTISSLVEQPQPDLSDLVDVLANRIGERRIYRYAPVASDVPERSVTRIPALAPAQASGWSGSWPRPPRLLAHPEPIETIALLPDQPPVSFVWRGIRRRVRRADGPERIFGEWWKRDAEMIAVRDYFRVEDEAGERYWIFRAGDGEDRATGSHRWFLHGIFA